MVPGLIYLDNYDEALDSVEEVRRSLLVALIDRKITKYISNYDGIVKKFETDKYFIVIKNKYLKELQANRFSLLEEVKAVNIGNEMSVTLSIGIGINGGSYQQNYEFSRIAIELALGRGGDQAVVKENDKISYYGGKSQQMEKNTRVKARVKAQALREFIENSEEVVVMGHKITDIDSLGSAGRQKCWIRRLTSCWVTSTVLSGPGSTCSATAGISTRICLSPTSRQRPLSIRRPFLWLWIRTARPSVSVNPF